MGPLGSVYTNTNPSGNQEWEHFQITTTQTAPVGSVDFVTQTIPAGNWTLRLHGLDLANLVYFRIPFDVSGEPTGSIGDRVWNDTNHDGVQDSGEADIPGVPVSLYQDNGDGVFCPGDQFPTGCDANGSNAGPIVAGPDTLVSTKLTAPNATPAADGKPQNYNFVGVPAGTYWVATDATSPALAGLTETYDEDDGDEGFGTRPFATPNATKVVLPPGVDHITADFGYVDSSLVQSLSSIGDTVYLDTSGDGIWQPFGGEAGVNGVLINLYQDNGDGIFCPVGRTDLLPACNGVGNDTLKAQRTTQSLSGIDGQYLFTGVDVGTYFVEVDTSNYDTGKPLHGLTQTIYPPLPNDDGVNRPSPWQVTISAANTSYLLADFGYVNAAIGDTVFEDTNRNGTQDNGELGIPGVKVNLYNDVNGSGSLDAGDTPYAADPSQTTDANGHYLFGNLPNGQYVVEVDASNFNSGQALDGLGQTITIANPDANSNNNNHPTPLSVTIANSVSYLNADFGYVQLAAIGDTVWADLNNDGIWQPANEPGIPGVVVNLYNDVNGNGQYDQGTDTPFAANPTQTTDAGGQYLFDNIPDGKYIVQIAPANSNQGQPLYGFTQTIVPGGGDVDGHNHSTPLGVTITNGVPYFNADFGYVIHFTLRKQIFRYWDSPQYTVNYDVPDNTSFQVKVYKLDNSVQPPAYADYLFDQNGQPQASGLVLSVSQANPVAVNLGPGDYKFCEINVPAGYLPAYKYGTADQGCFTWSAGQYPDYSMANVITFDLSVKKSGVTSAKPGATITYNYVVQNAGPASVKPTIADNLCKNVVLKSGDANNDGLIQPDETWTYSCDYPVPQAQQCGSTIVNTVIVGDAADPKPPSDHWVLKGETDPANNTDSWSVAVDCGTQVCLQGTDPKTASQTGAVINTTVNANGTITIRVTLSRGFADTAYGPNSTATGWPGRGGRKFKQIWTSDELEMKLKDANGNVTSDYMIDLLSPDTNAPSGYSSSGIVGGSGNRDGALRQGQRVRYRQLGHVDRPQPEHIRVARLQQLAGGRCQLSLC